MLFEFLGITAEGSNPVQSPIAIHRGFPFGIGPDCCRVFTRPTAAAWQSARTLTDADLPPIQKIKWPKDFAGEDSTLIGRRLERM
jgi:hypothetical protein